MTRWLAYMALAVAVAVLASGCAGRRGTHAASRRAELVKQADEAAAKWKAETGIAVEECTVGPIPGRSDLELRVLVANVTNVRKRAISLEFALLDDTGKLIGTHTFECADFKPGHKFDGGMSLQYLRPDGTPTLARLENVRCGQITGEVSPPAKPATPARMTPAFAEAAKQAGITIDQYGTCLEPGGRMQVLYAVRNTSSNRYEEVRLGYNSDESGNGKITTRYEECGPLEPGKVEELTITVRPNPGPSAIEFCQFKLHPVR